MIGFVLFLLLLGAIAAYATRVLVPGPDPMSFWQILLLAVAGSVVGGLFGSAVFRTGEGLMFSRSGVIGSIIGAIVVVLFYRMISARRRRTDAR